MGGSGAVRFAELGQDLFTGGHDAGEHRGSEPRGLQREQEILGGRVAACSRSERTAAQAAECSVDHRGPGLDGGDAVGDSQPPGVVPVEHDLALRCHVADAFDEVPHLVRRGLAECVTETTLEMSAARPSRTKSTTRCGSTGPRYGQVNAVARDSCSPAPATAAKSTASGKAAMLCSVVRPTLAQLCWSLTDRQYSRLRAPASIARVMPRGVAVHTQHRCSSSGVSAPMTSRVLAMGGTLSGRAIAPISKASMPESSSTRASSTLISVSSSLPVSCKPSRKVTSRNRTAVVIRSAPRCREG